MNLHASEMSNQYRVSGFFLRVKLERAGPGGQGSCAVECRARVPPRPPCTHSHSHIHILLGVSARGDAGSVINVVVGWWCVVAGTCNENFHGTREKSQSSPSSERFVWYPPGPEAERRRLSLSALRESRT